MSDKNGFTAYINGHDSVSLVHPNGFEECFELYHTENDVNFDAVKYSVNSVEYKVLSGALDKLRAELYGTDRVPMPKLNKDCIQTVVQLRKSVINKSGEVFPAGALMVVMERNKAEGRVTLRPLRGSISMSELGVDYVGTKQELGLHPKQ